MITTTRASPQSTLSSVKLYDAAPLVVSFLLAGAATSRMVGDDGPDGRGADSGLKSEAFVFISWRMSGTRSSDFTTDGTFTYVVILFVTVMLFVM